MVQTDEAKQILNEIRTLLGEAQSALGLETLKDELSELQNRMEAPGFWDDIQEAHKVNKKIKPIEDKLEQFSKISARLEEAAVLLELVEEGADAEMADELDFELAALKKEVSELRLKALLRGEYDFNGAILSLHAGAGGTEAQELVEMQ